MTFTTPTRSAPRFTAMVLAFACICAASVVAQPVSTAAGGKQAARPTTLDARHKGLVVPSKHVVLLAPLDGIVSSIKVTKGQVVKVGDVLAVMDDEIQQLVVGAAKLRADSDAAIRVAQLTLEEANIEIERAEDLYQKKAITERELRQRKVVGKQKEAELQAAHEQAALADANLKLEEAKLRKHAILAPFNGTVTDLIAEEGATMARNEKVLVLAALSELDARINLPDTFFNQMQGKVGQSFRMLAGSPVDREVKGTLKVIRSIIDTGSATFLCEFTIDNADLKMPAGFSVDLVWPQ